MFEQTFDSVYLISVFVAMAAVSFIERALPFVASKWLKRQQWVGWLGEFLPMAIMVLLTVHAAIGASVSRAQQPWMEISAIALTVCLQWFLKSPLISICAGTGLYIALVNGWISI